MIKNAIGLIETVGLAAGVEAADAAVKSANVKLIGYELTKGDGMCTVKVEGDVGAVKAAVAAATAAASKVSAVFSTNVIPRPAQGLENLIFTKDTVGLEKEETPVKAVTEKPAPKATAPAEPSAPAEAVKPAETQIVIQAEEPEVKAPEAAPEADNAPSETEAEDESEPQEAAKAETPEKHDAKPKAKPSSAKKGKGKKK